MFLHPSVSHSVCQGGVSAQGGVCHTLPPADTPRQTAPQVDTPQADTPRADTLPGRWDGTHPTAMLSC